MDSKNIKSSLQDALEKELPSAQVDLLSAVQSRLVVGKKVSNQQGEKMNKTPTKRLVFSALTVVALIAISLATPQGRAFAQSILQFFTRAESDAFPLQPWQIAHLEDDATALPPMQLYMIISDVEKLAGYNLLLIPDKKVVINGFQFRGATFEPKNNMVLLFYARVFEGDNIEESFMLSEQQLGSPKDIYPLQGVVGASAPVEEVKVGNFQGEYIEGVWKLTNNGPVWSQEPFLKTLRWRTETLFIELVYGGNVLTKGDLINLAENMK